MKIKNTVATDLHTILYVENKAFGNIQGPEIVKLVKVLLNDPSAMPLLSLLAMDENQAVGHILFTQAQIINANNPISTVILAPLAVIPTAQSQGIGGKLIKEGLKRLSKLGVELVFVLGHPEYYPRYGFKPAGMLGFEAPYPIPEQHANAWMVQELRPNIIGNASGKVKCADVLNQPEHWCE